MQLVGGTQGEEVLQVIKVLQAFQVHWGTALKVALYDFFDGPLAPLNGQFMEKVNHYNSTKQKDFLIGPSAKFVSTHL